MKTKLAIFIFILGATVLAREEQSTNTSSSIPAVWTYGNVTKISVAPEIVVDLFKDKEFRDKAIRMLIARGYLCAYVGHRFESIPHVTLEYRPNGDYPEHRRCSLCGIQQTKEPSAWK